MDQFYQFPSFLSLISIFFILVLVKRILLLQSIDDDQTPPGPKCLPIIGNLHNLAGQLPHRALRSLANTYGPLMRLRLGQVDVVVASSREAAVEILKTQDLNFASRFSNITTAKIISYNNLDILMAPYGEYWRQLRRICNDELLSAVRVKSFSSFRHSEALKLVDRIRASGATGPMNLTAMLTTTTMTIIALCAFGSNCEHAEAFMSAARVTTELAGGFCLADLFPGVKYLDVLTGIKSRIMRSHRKLDEILCRMVEEHRVRRADQNQELREDLVDVLLRIKESGDPGVPLADDTNIKALLLDMFVAGTETTTITMEWAMAELMRNPDCMKKVQDELRRVLKRKTSINDEDLKQLHYLKQVIKETLRLHPPGPLLSRQCVETCRVLGYKVDAGTRVIVNAWALGRDPRYWKDPESFNPERFEGYTTGFTGHDLEYIPFGAGRRVCPGITFGSASMDLILAHLLFHFNWSLPTGITPKDLDMSENSGLVAARNCPLCLVGTPYVPA